MAFGQEDYNNFYRQSMKTNNTGMYVLGTWAVSNIAVSGIGWSRRSGSTKYFHQMNVFWNVVNLSIAGVALYNNHTTDILAMNPGEMMKEHVKIQKLYLINAGLDIGYIGTGLLLRHLSSKKPNRKNLFKGYGNSVILQGGFLLVFDAVMYLIQRNHRLDFLETMDLSMSHQAVMMKISVSLL